MGCPSAIRTAPLAHSSISMLTICRAEPVAEQLPQRLFVPGDAVALDQREKVLRRVAAQRRLGEMRVGGEIAVRARPANW
jgi:hypothetical protein